MSNIGQAYFLLDVQKLSHDCLIGAEQFDQLNKPLIVGEQRTSALRFGDHRVFALMRALCQFTMNPQGLRHSNRRPAVTQLLGTTADDYTQGKMTYDLRRLRLYGIIERIAGSHRYQLTVIGIKVTQLFTHPYARVIQPAPSVEGKVKKKTSSTLAIDYYDTAISKLLEQAQLT